MTAKQNAPAGTGARVKNTLRTAIIYPFPDRSAMERPQCVVCKTWHEVGKGGVCQQCSIWITAGDYLARAAELLREAH